MSFPDVPEVIRRRMARIRKVDTKPEILVRQVAHGLGYRFRLHRRDLPGTPDLVFPGRHKVILVHGCFWHQHDCKLGRRRPSSHKEYWEPKLDRNIARDRVSRSALMRLGWGVMVIWECEIGDVPALAGRVRAFLEG